MIFDSFVSDFKRISKLNFEIFSPFNVFLLGWKFFVSLSSCTSFCSLHVLSAMLIVIVYLLQLSKFLRRSLMIFLIRGFRTIVFIFIVISITFRPICPPAFFRCLLNSGTFTELQTTSFIESTGVTCFVFVSHNRVQVLSIPVLLLTCSQDWTCNLQMIVS